MILHPRIQQMTILFDDKLLVFTVESRIPIVRCFAIDFVSYCHLQKTVYKVLTSPVSTVYTITHRGGGFNVRCLGPFIIYPLEFANIFSSYDVFISDSKFYMCSCILTPPQKYYSHVGWMLFQYINGVMIEKFV